MGRLIKGPALYFIILFCLTLIQYCRVLFAIGGTSLYSSEKSIQKDHSSQRIANENDTAVNNETIAINTSLKEEDMTQSTATILSRTTQLNKLLMHLDASDVIECYVVNRMAPLASVASNFGVGNDNNNNVETVDNAETKKTEVVQQSSASATTTSTSTNSIPTGPVLVRKSALAFRYRSRVALASHGHHFSTGEQLLDNLSPGDQLEKQKYFELTLEYGPQRTGVAKTSESMPRVHVDIEHVLGEKSETATSDNDNIDNYIGKYVSWHNEGSVYHTTQISSDWTDAYYMASITGVVLEKIIQRAVEYTYKQPRYQPFEVISIPSQKQIIRSSGSEDFVYEMFHELADLYVDIDPLVLPPRGRVQFYVADPPLEEETGGKDDSGSDIKKKRLNPNVQKINGSLEASRAALFYENFFNCANSIRTGDYSMFNTPSPSSMPSVAPMETNSGVEYADDLVLSRSQRRRLLDEIHSNVTDENLSLDTFKTNFTADEEGEIPGSIFQIYNSTLIDLNNTDSDGGEIIIEDDPAEIAEKAAIVAVKAAEKAVSIVATNTSSAADTAAATIEASKAAQKAKEASVAARSKASAEALLSGDGELMTTVLSTCFTDPKYGIRINNEQVYGEDYIRGNDLVEGENKTDHIVEMQESPVAYIYIDGHVFFRLTLAAPYCGLISSFISVPPPNMPPQGKSDIIDWAIVILILMGTLFGFFVMMHQVGCIVDERFKFRHVFHPTMSESDWALEGELSLKGGRELRASWQKV